MSTYFVHDLESDKLHIFTGRETWRTLASDLRDLIKRYCLFSRTQECWISKGKAGHVWYKDKLVAGGFEDRGKVGERMAFADSIEAKQERAADRAERYDARAEQAEEESARRHKISHDMMGAIPMGQPILVGHYSEKRDRAYRARAWAHLGKAVEASDRAKHYEGRAETARRTAAGEQLQSAGYLSRRIEETDKEVRTLVARLEGRHYLNSEQQGFVPTERDTAHWKERLTAELEKLEYYEGKLEEIGGVAFSRESLAGKQAVKLRGRWELIVKLNPKTVSIPNICYPTAELQAKYALKYAYAEVTEAR